MSKYRKKPVIITAEVYEKGMEDGYDKVVPHKCFCCDLSDCNSCDNYRPFIKTLEGKMFISEGDYIITGVKGERYPCKPDIFKETYEKVEEGCNESSLWQ